MTALCPGRPNSVKVKVERERLVGHSLAEDGYGDVDGQDVGDAEQRDEFHWPVPEQPVDDALVQLVRSLLDGCTEEHLTVKTGPSRRRSEGGAHICPKRRKSENYFSVSRSCLINSETNGICCPRAGHMLHASDIAQYDVMLVKPLCQGHISVEATLLA